MISRRVEGKRGCGYRAPGGYYLVAGAPSAHCFKTPYPLTVCPTCSQGIKPARGFTWLNTVELCKHDDHPACEVRHCEQCPLGGAVSDRVGLIWVGEAFYKTPYEFAAEAIKMGISRRITAIPRGFVVGETWVLLAHKKALQAEKAVHGDEGTETENIPGIFQAFRPTAIEYVVRGDETEEEIKSLEKRGITPVEVVRGPQNEELFKDRAADLN